MTVPAEDCEQGMMVMKRKVYIDENNPLVEEYVGKGRRNTLTYNYLKIKDEADSERPMYSSRSI